MKCFLKNLLKFLISNTALVNICFLRRGQRTLEYNAGSSGELDPERIIAVTVLHPTYSFESSFKTATMAKR